MRFGNFFLHVCLLVKTTSHLQISEILQSQIFCCTHTRLVEKSTGRAVRGSYEIGLKPTCTVHVSTCKNCQIVMSADGKPVEPKQKRQAFSSLLFFFLVSFIIQQDKNGEEACRFTRFQSALIKIFDSFKINKKKCPRLLKALHGKCLWIPFPGQRNKYSGLFRPIQPCTLSAN